LKKAAPLLVNVAFLIGFFWLLFAIIGVQNFKSSLRRTCVWYEDIENVHTNKTNNFYAQNVAPDNIQFCGGHLDKAGIPQPWLKEDLHTNGSDTHKGYICPYQSLCVEGSNPYNGTVSFDNVLQSLQLVFVIMSSNTFSDLLYYTTDSDILVAALC
jgi:voltage-dependent calcium channel